LIYTKCIESMRVNEIYIYILLIYTKCIESMRVNEIYIYSIDLYEMYRINES